jgi:hypothetical protein
MLGRPWTLLPAIWLCGLLACGIPADGRVRSEFMARHPGYSLVFVGVGEGDGDNAYFTIRYKKPGDTRTFEQEWLYQNIGGKEWTCTHRSDEVLSRNP